MFSSSFVLIGHHVLLWYFVVLEILGNGTQTRYQLHVVDGCGSELRLQWYLHWYRGHGYGDRWFRVTRRLHESLVVEVLRVRRTSEKEMIFRFKNLQYIILIKKNKFWFRLREKRYHCGSTFSSKEALWKQMTLFQYPPDFD